LKQVIEDTETQKTNLKRQLRQQRLENRNLRTELETCKELLEEQKIESNNSKSIFKKTNGKSA